MQDNLISKKILGYDDLIQIPSGENNERLVDVRTYSPSIAAQYNKQDMLPYTGEIILVRETVAKKLAAVNDALRTQGLGLRIVYGYRHPEVQKDYFSNRKAELRRENSTLDESLLDRLTHNFVAVPDVAGHPTGGAVDLTLIDDEGVEIDMGTRIADYSDPEAIKTFAAMNEMQMSNRKLLHDMMVAQGFAPFYGEWWHFSWGDREWAAFYGKKEALYGAINLD